MKTCITGALAKGSKQKRNEGWTICPALVPFLFRALWNLSRGKVCTTCLAHAHYCFVANPGEECKMQNSPVVRNIRDQSFIERLLLDMARHMAHIDD